MNLRIACLVATVFAMSPVFAEGIPVEPGLWSVTTTVTMPMLPAPQTNTMEECFTEEMIDMDDMSTEDMDPDCAFNQARVDGNTMEWTIDCPVEGGTMQAEWSATSEGDSVEGSGTMTMNMAGQTMNMSMTWAGKRIGDCP